MDMTVDSLLIEVQAKTAAAEKGIDNLSDSLSKLGKATRGLGLSGVVKQFKSVGTALNAMDSASISKLDALSNALGKLSAAGNVKISSSIANQITNLGTATKSLDGADFSKLADLANAISPLATIGKTNLGSTVSQLSKLPAAVQPLSTMDMGGLNRKLRDLVEAVKPLAEMGKANLSSTLNQIKKLPEAFTTLNSLDMTSFAKKIKEVAAALAPLADEMQKVANGFSAFPAKIQKLLNATNQIPRANARAGASYVDFVAKIAIAYTAIRQTVRTIGSWIGKSNDYIESINLFNVSMGSYADEAYKFAQMVGDAMGIDPGEWMRNQGVFMTLATGVGVASDRAYTMSQNLTQLGYDLSSFFNITFEDAMQKLQSGISGELEPLRRLGYDLSQAKLEAVALSLGIDKAVSSMTQAEKAELRYYAIMTQVTTAQGDMARTLDAPANQLRVLKSQTEQAARALGNIFIPALNAILPYLIAVAKVVQYVASAIASLFGFSLPEVDYSGVGELASGATDASDAIDDTTGSVKELKKSLLGIDELNVLSDNANSGSGVNVGGGNFDFELPTYDFIGDLTESRVGQIVKEMKEWLGLTEDIGSWSELMDTRFGHILKLVGLISAGFATWKLSNAFLAGIATLKALLESPIQTITLGLALTLTGFAIEFSGVADAIQNGLEGFYFGEIVLGALLGTGGAALLGKGIASWIGKAFADKAVSKALATAATNLFGAELAKKMGAGAVGAAGAAIGAGVGAIIAGIPAFIAGIYDAITTELDWMNAALTAGGATAAGAGIGTIVGALGGPIGAGAGALIGLVVGLATDGIILLVQNWETVSTWFQGICATVGEFFSGLWQGVSTAASGCWEAITSFFSPAIEWFSQLFGSVFQTLSDIFYNIGVIASGCWEVIKAVWVVVSGWFDSNIIQPVSEFFSDLWTGFVDGAQSAWEAVKSVFSSVATFFGDIFSEAWQKVVNVFSVAGEIFTDIKDGVLAGFKVVVNGIIKGLNSAIAVPFNGINWALDKIKSIEIAGIKPFDDLKTISVPQIPLLADGGMVNTGQVFVAREAGPEMVGRIGNRTAVANNDQIVASVSEGVYSAVIAAMRSREGNENRPVNIYLDGKLIMRSVEKHQHERGASLMGKQVYGY